MFYFAHGARTLGWNNILKGLSYILYPIRYLVSKLGVASYDMVEPYVNGA